MSENRRLFDCIRFLQLLLDGYRCVNLISWGGAVQDSKEVNMYEY